ELHGFNDATIRDAIMHELNRGGQVFFIHNRVQNIYELQAYIQKLVPEASTAVGHGQMEGAKLEKILLDFIDGNFDILIATTIIESGLDVPNANTIIINQAHQFGLSELHQLRGRVGRSNIKAFCYLLAPPLPSLTWEARRRLKALEDYSELGSGFHLAMQDLDIRGAGNLLGGEQSGFISDIGYETYQRILDEAILELRTTEFKELFADEEQKTEQNFVTDCQIDTDFEALIPEDYVENTAEKIKLYRELDNITKESELQQFAKKLTDRFGTIPEETTDLMHIVRMREMAKDLGFERLILKQKLLIAHLVTDQQSAFYNSAIFHKLLQAVQIQIVPLEITETKDKLRLKVKNVRTVTKALDIVEKLWLFCKN
nr:transcription-repair coupling factor [Flavobacteriaceae bacterium]